jgi:hypothetical protein
MATETLHLKLTERARRQQHMSHLSPALLLIFLGIDALLGGHSERLWLDLLGLIVGLALLIAFKREISSKGRHHSRIGWIDVIAGLVLIVEGLHKLHSGKWFQPGTVTMLLGVAVILIGLLHNRLPKLRRLTCTDEDFSLRTRPISSLALMWQEIEKIELKDLRLVLALKDGTQRTINLRRIENRAEAAEMLKTKLAESKETLVEIGEG